MRSKQSSLDHLPITGVTNQSHHPFLEDVRCPCTGCIPELVAHLVLGLHVKYLSTIVGHRAIHLRCLGKRRRLLRVPAARVNMTAECFAQVRAAAAGGTNS
jgi:hypothetical protein